MPVVASPTPAGVEEPEGLDAVRALQHALYRAAKADPGRRFHPLAARRVLIPKPGSTEQRPLSIPTERA